MSTKRTHFPRTTHDQRRLLFETWQATGNITKACQLAHVSRQTFYVWLPRFTAEGFAGVLECASPAPKQPHRIDPAIEPRVIALRQEHPSWGKQRIADQLTQENQWVPLVSRGTVRRILHDAGLWPAPALPGKKKDGLTFVSRTAEQPGQTLNVDLCFVPADHPAVLKLPAVSGSSGRLLISAPPTETAKPFSPGQVFADKSLDYSEAMLRFVAASRDADGRAPARPSETPVSDEKSSVKAQQQACQRAADELRVARRQTRAQRTLEDRAWQALRAQPASAVPADPTAPAPTRAADAERQRSLRAQRRAQQQQRAVEDEQWRQRRRQVRTQWSALPLISAWIAILVITDNCTRQCLGLPLFVTGPKVTAELIVAALQELLPPELQFLISDRGSHFIAKAFRALKQDANFIHVLIARHRPQSNGIAERFVRTLKEWLATQSWQSDAELEILLAQFIAEYNDRPHRGLAMPGLSPNEFANRCWLF